MINVRTKGHNLEREDVKILKEFFPNAMTTRNGSTYMDNCGIDIMNIPMAWQCKNGYTKGINYQTLIDNIQELQKQKLNTELPVIIHHKKGRKREDNFIVMYLEEFLKVFKPKELKLTLHKNLVKIEYFTFIERCLRPKYRNTATKRTKLS